ncbi:hypothetical protein Bbelb_197030 [Branchiostoma belcheri]|nr:hypothetical protein Bbelb_197030 [Branchiostoma belcheri]
MFLGITVNSVARCQPVSPRLPSPFTVTGSLDLMTSALRTGSLYLLVEEAVIATVMREMCPQLLKDTQIFRPRSAFFWATLHLSSDETAAKRKEDKSQRSSRVS